MKHFCRFVLFWFCFVFQVVKVSAENKTTQLWYEYMLNLPFGKNFNFENAFTYSRQIKNEKWRAYDYSATIEYSVNPYLDLSGQLIASYTNQSASYNTFEIRPVAGARIIITPVARLRARIFLRLENRNFKNLENNSWINVVRPRARAELIYYFGKNISMQKNLLYVFTDAEWLYKTDLVEERFANRFRWRNGIGYRMNYSLAFEFAFMIQRSRNTATDNFETSDQVFRFRIKHYLSKSKANGMVKS